MYFYQNKFKKLLIDFIKTLTPILIGFFILALSSKNMSKFFKKIHLPGITGMLFTGILVGPYVLNFISHEDLKEMKFMNEIALSFIAFFAGTELYLIEIRDRIKHFAVETLAQVVFIFFIGLFAFYFLADYIPFMANMSNSGKWAVALLGATVFITRSPSSALAIIREMRAKGNFSKTAISVTVIIDFVVIVIFAITLAMAVNLTSGQGFDIIFLVVVLLEIALAVLFGYVLSKIIGLVFRINMSSKLKAISLLILGFGTYYSLHLLAKNSGQVLPFSIHVEALLVCIVAGFWVTNYSNYRKEFHEALNALSPYVYIVFFTLTGAHLALDYFIVVWKIALVLFAVRVFAVMLGSFVGASINKESMRYKTISWSGYITQAGVGIGLATIVAGKFPEWGYSFYTLILSVIVLNEIVGPALFKFGIKRMGESHLKYDSAESNPRDVLIFGMEPQSVSLARQLQLHGWSVKIVGSEEDSRLEEVDGVTFVHVIENDIESLRMLDCAHNEAIVLMLDDDENLFLAETIYEEFGNKNVIARIKDRTFFEEFVALGVRVVEPYTSMINLLDNMVRSPNATSILLGIDDKQETLDIEIRDKSFDGIQLRYLRLPADILILSINRKDEVIITHGYTRLKLGDIVTVIGSHESLEDVLLQFSE